MAALQGTHSALTISRVQFCLFTCPASRLYKQLRSQPNLPSQRHVEQYVSSSRNSFTRLVAVQSQTSGSISSVSEELASCNRGALLRGQLGNDAGVLWFEVRRRLKDGLELLCDGEVLTLKFDSEEMAHTGSWPRVSDAWVKKCPELYDTLKSLRKQQEADGTLPSQLIAQHGVTQLSIVTSLDSFTAEVNTAPGYWCDGTGPNDPPSTELQTTLLTAGELVAFLGGHRGVCLLQVSVNWESGASPPLLRPFVLSLLEQVCNHKGVGILSSPAPGQFGATVVLHAKQQPFKARAAFLAKTGVQAGLVADSPYYKLLIGYILGYKEENILHHISSYGGHVTSKVIKTAQDDLAAMNNVTPQLPWPANKKAK